MSDLGMLDKNIFEKRKINPWRHFKRFTERHCFGIGSGLDLDSDGKFHDLK
jgi:hypothetical protein